MEHPEKSLYLLAPMKGRIVPLEEVPDQVFSQKMVGEGIALLPVEGEVLAPLGGEVVALFPTGHALGIRSPQGLEVLIHVGVETVGLQGKGFTLHVAKGARVEPGEKLITVDLEYVQTHAPSLLTPVILTNMEKVQRWEILREGEVDSGEPLLSVTLQG